MEPLDIRHWKGFFTAGGDLSSPSIVQHICIDSRRVADPQTLFIALQGSTTDGHAFVADAAQRGAQYALVRNSWQPPTDLPPIRLLRVADPLRSLQELAQLYRLQRPCRVVGIAGSYGKTMVKDLLALFLAQKYTVATSPESFNSQIGVPLSLFTLRDDHTVALIEAAVSQPGEMDRLASMIAPDAAIVTHVGRKHLTTMGSVENTAKEMNTLLQHSRCCEWCLVPNASFASHAPHFVWKEKSPSLPFASSVASSLSTQFFYRIAFPETPSYTGVATVGFSYYLDLINITVQAAWLLGVDREELIAVLETYTPTPMRMELWKSAKGPLVINDTYGSDPLSIDQSLTYFPFGSNAGKRIFLLNGLQKDHPNPIEYERIAQSLNQAGIHQLHLTGGIPRDPFERAATFSLHRHPSLSSALESLIHATEKEDTLLIKGKEKIPLETIADAWHAPLSPNRCIVNLAAIETNLQKLRSILPPQTRLMVIIKAFAYGADSSRIAPFLVHRCGIDIVGVSTIDEAIQLRESGIHSDIFLIHATYHDAAQIVRHDIQVGASDRLLIESLERETSLQQKTCRIHLHIDTGMKRFGCPPEEALSLAQHIVAAPCLILEGAMTHLACADDPQEDVFTHRQVEIFDHRVATFRRQGIHPPYTHVCASSGAIRFSFSQHNMVRIAIAAYGLYTSDAVRDTIDLHLALSLTSRVVAINPCKKGDTISYGRRYRVEKEEQTIAVLPIGYHDGLHRHYSETGYVLIHGKKASMVGTICMDFMMVDVTEIPSVQIGDTALIFGEDEYGHFLAPEELAARGNSITHELITCLGPRIQRIFVYEEANSVR